MCILCDMEYIRTNDGLTASVKINKLCDLMIELVGSVDRIMNICNACHAMGVIAVPIEHPAFGALFGFLEHRDKRAIDKVLDNPVPELDPEVLAKFRKGN